MLNFLIKRFLKGLVSVLAIVAIVMALVYLLLDKNQIFANDESFVKLYLNQKEIYKYEKWEEYGYLDYVSYSEFIDLKINQGEIEKEDRASIVSIGRTESLDSQIVKEWTLKFKNYYENKGYSVLRLNAIMQSANKVKPGGNQQLFAYKNNNLIERLINYFKNIVSIDNIHYVKENIKNRGISFTLYDPAYGGDKFSPAIMGNGTKHKYLLYFDNTFPYIHQNLISISLGVSYSVSKGNDIYDIMTSSQGGFKKTIVTFPTGLVEETADDLHTATYSKGSLATSEILQERFVDDYTNVSTRKVGLSKLGYSFLIGIIAVIISYVIAVPLGIYMARKKEGLVDKLGTIYIIFIMAVPSLAYIFIFKSIGRGIFNLPTIFEINSKNLLVYVLPIISLALPQAANLLRWLRRYMIDHMNSEYVKFSRSLGLSEGQIFSKHILKNAIIPIVHGIPASILGCLAGAIITERVYVVPGAGNLLTDAITAYDNGVIVGLTLFFAVLSIISLILGDILMGFVDPRISFEGKGR